jgi:hypothetical protein
MKVIEVVATNEIIGRAIGGLVRLVSPIEKFKDAGRYATSAANKVGAMSATARNNQHLLKIPVFGKFMYNSRIKNAGKAFELAKANQAAVAFNNLGAGLLNIISILGIGNAVIDYYAASIVITESNLSPEEKEEKLTELKGILVLKVIGIAIISKTAQLGTVITKILPGVMKFLPGTTLPKLGIAGSEAINFVLRIGAGGLAGIFSTEKGTTIIRDYIAGWIINGIGWAADNAVTFVKEVYEYSKAAIKYAQGYRAKNNNEKETDINNPEKNNEKETDINNPDSSNTPSAKDILNPGMSIGDLAARMTLRTMGLGSK